MTSADATVREHWVLARELDALEEKVRGIDRRVRRLGHPGVQIIDTDRREWRRVGGRNVQYAVVMLAGEIPRLGEWVLVASQGGAGRRRSVRPQGDREPANGGHPTSPARDPSPSDRLTAPLPAGGPA